MSHFESLIDGAGELGYHSENPEPDCRDCELIEKAEQALQMWNNLRHPAIDNIKDRSEIETLAELLHKVRMKTCYTKGYDHNQPWPDKMPPDFGYVPQPWVDIAWAQAK